MKSTIFWPYMMMAYIRTLGNDGEGHFTEENRDIKAEKFDVFKK